MDISTTVTIFIILCGVIGILFSLFQFRRVSKVGLGGSKLLQEENERMMQIYEAIREGADSFLKAEYKVCSIFIVFFGALVFVLTSYTSNENKRWNFTVGAFTALSFVLGAVTSMLSGYIGMKVAVYSNVRTTISANGDNAWTNAFNTAFCAGSVMGFSLCGLALLVLYGLIGIVSSQFDYTNREDLKTLFECVAGFGLGGSSIAMFGRVGGGIYTKAADVGADLAGKVIAGIPEDDPRNPATIADNVGDNVGDVAGMGADLFGSFGEASCACLVVIASSVVFSDPSTMTGDELGLPDWGALMFPLMISAVGILVCLVTSFLATHIAPVRKETDIEFVLKVQLAVTSLLITAVLYPIASLCLSNDDKGFWVRTNNAGGLDANGSPVPLQYYHGTPLTACVCVWAGLWAGCAIGFITEYYTSHSYAPTREVAQSCETGAATNIIFGLALGMKSAIIPVFLLAIVVWLSFFLLDMFGVALAALGMLSNLATCLSIDVYGPICDNAGGIAEMSELDSSVRDITDALDAAGNTTAAIGKGFAIGSACLVGLALFGAYIKRANLVAADVTVLSPLVFAFLLIGAMIPYWFTAMTMKSVGQAAKEMVIEVERQFREIPGLREGTPGHGPPDHARCIDISTKASLREMILPAVLIMTAPLITGVFFGHVAVAGLLSGAISSSIQLAISSSNTGGAWDNAKKYVEKGMVKVKGEVQGKGSELHKAAVVGDTVGDPLKDTSGPALNIVMKLMAILALVFADFFSACGQKGLIMSAIEKSHHPVYGMVSHNATGF